MRVCLDAGHGGKDPGAVYDGLIEKQLNLELSEICHSVLTKRHITITTRDKDEFISIRDRASYANANDVDIFISLHHNASGSHKARGCEVLFYPHTSTENIEFAQRMVGVMGNHWVFARNRGAKPGWYRGDPNRGVLGVLRRTRMPAFIIEPAFLDSLDRKWLLEDEQRRYFYIAIANSIKEALNETPFT